MTPNAFTTRIGPIQFLPHEQARIARVVAQPPGYRTGGDIGTPIPAAVRKALHILSDARVDLADRIERSGRRHAAGVSTTHPGPRKAKKIPAGAATPLGNSFNQIKGMK